MESHGIESIDVDPQRPPSTQTQSGYREETDRWAEKSERLKARLVEMEATVNDRQAHFDTKLGMMGPRIQAELTDYYIRRWLMLRKEAERTFFG
eukprot:2774235-Amphidinium_carterae.2